MTDITEYVKQAAFACESCEFVAEEGGTAMVHSLTIGHVLTGKTPEGDIVTISTVEA